MQRLPRGGGSRPWFVEDWDWPRSTDGTVFLESPHPDACCPWSGCLLVLLCWLFVTDDFLFAAAHLVSNVAAVDGGVHLLSETAACGRPHRARFEVQAGRWLTFRAAFVSIYRGSER